MVRSVAAACIAVCALAVAAPARALADVWPQPADGNSRSGDPEIVFTFDDGPNPLYTPKILDILKQYDIKAIFFLLGLQVEDDAPKIRPTLRRLMREGHVLANHTYGHKDLCRERWKPMIGVEIDAGREALVDVLHVEPVWFRAPFGARCPELDAALAERGITHFHWDLDPQEWRHGNATRTYEYIVKKIGETRGRSVVLLHDVKGVTVRALPRVLEWIAFENVRRIVRRERPIRIIQGPQIAEERLAPGLVDWAFTTVDRIRGVRRDLSSVIP